jgi:hypothetical protein
MIGQSHSLRAVVAAALLLWVHVHGVRSQTPVIPDPVKSGQEIATRLRTAGPPESADFQGTLIVTRPASTNTVSISSRISLSATNWQVTYVAGSERLTIVHSAEGPNRYFAGAPSGGKPGELLESAALYRSFAGSDFWVADLGLEFLHWPQQRHVMNQMRRSRSCRVLESITPNPQPEGYARVLTWVDVESDGILRAEAYDKKNRMIKEFLVGSFRKQEGRYHLESMTIRIPKTENQSEIRFDIGR